METFVVTPELRALYHRAIENPTSITRSERNQINILPPPEEEDCNMQTRFDLNSRSELISKANTSPESFTSDEVDYLTPLDRTWDLITKEDRELRYKAKDDTMPVGEWTAIRNARMRLSQRRAKASAESQKRLEHREYLRSQPRAQWVQRMVDADVQRWGFVYFRTAYSAENTSDERWDLFKTYYGRAGQHVINRWNGFSELWPMHMTIFISDATLDGSSAEVLRERFHNMRKGGQIPDGVRTDVFLVADEETLADESIASGKYYNVSPAMFNVFRKESKDMVRIAVPLMRAIDPDCDAGTTPVPMEGKYAGFDGEISFPLPKAFDWLHYSFFAGSETWQGRYSRTRKTLWAPYKFPHTPYPWYGPGYFLPT